MNRNVCFWGAMGLLAVALGGCGGGRVARQLDAAEAAMEAHPDSALALLQAVDGSRLTGEPQARHALLLSQAYNKNYIDVTDDSLISIATNYYSGSDDPHHEMLANYYLAFIHLGNRDYARALAAALKANAQAEALGDTYYLTRSEFAIASAYLFSYNNEGAEEYFNIALAHTYELNMPQWIGLAYENLASVALDQKDFDKAMEYADSLNAYLPGDKDVAEFYMIASIGQGNYAVFDSVYSQYSELYPDNLQMKAYSILSSASQGRNIRSCDSIFRLMEGASQPDSVELAGVGQSISLLLKDYYSAWAFNDIILNETNRVLADVSGHSLYMVQIDHEQDEARQLQMQLNHREQVILYLIIIALLVAMIFVFAALLIRKKHREDLLKAQNKILLLSADFSELQKSYSRETSRLSEEQLKNHIEIDSLCARIQQSKSAGQKLFLQHFSWIEELGNLVLDSEKSNDKPQNAVTTLKKRLNTVKSKEFLAESIYSVNIHRNNILERIKQESPRVAESEIEILALLCANLSPRIIGFILNIIPQSVYNAKSSIKRKLTADAPSLLAELSDVYPQ